MQNFAIHIWTVVAILQSKLGVQRIIIIILVLFVNCSNCIWSLLILLIQYFVYFLSLKNRICLTPFSRYYFQREKAWLHFHPLKIELCHKWICAMLVRHASLAENRFSLSLAQNNRWVVGENLCFYFQRFVVLWVFSTNKHV